jgi:hypothetical protein
MSFEKDLNTPLLSVSQEDAMGLQEVLRGQNVGGSFGARKTSGSPEFGSVVTCTKPEDADLWRRYVKRVGRGDCLLLPEED